MELNLLGTFERNAMPAMPSPAVDDHRAEFCLDLSLRLSSGDIASGKRRRENDEPVEGKRPKMDSSNDSFEPGSFSYGLQVVPIILPGPYENSCFATCWVPCSAETVENSVREGRASRSLPMPAGSGGPVACSPQSDVADGRSSPESSISRISDVFQTSNGEGSCTDDELKSHPNNNTHIDNPSSPVPATQMQAVSTKSAEGRRINGRLYQLTTKNEVRIICDCHGRFFSPARFVRHAGGAATPNPLRQITVVL